MRFDDRFLEDLKSRLRPSDVIGKSVKLRRQGREYAGLSPFTKEKSPSFFVNDDKGFYHCFSSGKHGDIISFLQETERLTFSEAVERLASEAGMALPELDIRAAKEDRKRQGLGEWMELAAAWFESELRRPVGKDARAYLERRSLPEDEWSRFRIGFAPNSRSGLKDYLIAKGAQPGDLVEAGILIGSEDGGAPYDRFRDRIIFPITDTRGKVVSFGGRAMDPAARAKYLNGPETSLFHKGRLLYGLYEARKILHAAQAAAPTESNPLVVVEGYMDVIACHRAGVAAVAAMGTAMTEEQMEVLWRLHPEPTLCFDGDKAGQRAASRAMDRALPLLKPGRSFRFSLVSGGKDPDDVLREQGPAALKAQLAATTPFVDALFIRERQTVNEGTPEGLAELKGKLRAAAGSIQDKDLSERYRIHLFGKFEEKFPNTYYGTKERSKFRSSAQHVINKNAHRILERRIKRFNAAVCIGGVDNPEWLMPFVDPLAEFGFGDDRLEPLKEPLLYCLYEGITHQSAVIRAINAHDATGILIRARAIANEVSSPPFFDERLPEEERKPSWERCFRHILELSAIELEISRKEPYPHSISDNETQELRRRFETSRIYIERRRVLKKIMSDLEWDAE